MGLMSYHISSPGCQDKGAVVRHISLTDTRLMALRRTVKAIICLRRENATNR